MAKKLLAAAPIQAAERKNPLALAMDKIENPKVGTGSGEDTDVDAEVNRILAVSGYKEDK